MVGVLHSTWWNNEGNNPGRHLELSGRRRAFALKMRRGKQVMGKGARIKHKATRARSRLNELTFGTFHVCTAVVNGVNGIGHINTLLGPCAARGCDVIGLQESKRNGTSKIVRSCHRVYFSRVKGRKGQHMV